ncbi:MAG TPA: Rieske 2Fe-2S domain-containing protein [Povalibacter sp.]|uniref:Rieske 2Fe-2S domain-containing protein n=1 Tax=Povalibacter sp. TaxID=1962978 RepID=UPI002C0273F9|nr:Rieske 2Fe-2S domain-containing protein [Povalibacter sp.]HMN43796.1 Rieske 2Fe-2S domain-containing protein [Povalibacter sp.]
MVLNNEIVTGLPDGTPVDYIRTGPGTLAGQYLRKFWQPVYVARKLEPGRSVPLVIMSQKLALYRSQEGKVHCVDNRCAHRGVMLSAGWVEGDNIRCPYHGWMYDGTGQCVQQPLEGRGFCKNVRIGGYPTQEYLGLIFIYLGEGEPPEFPRFPEWEKAKFNVAAIDTRGCNYFNNVENFQDEGHVWFTHRSSAFEALNLEMLPKLSVERTDWGLRNVATTPDGRRRETLFGMPNAGAFMVEPNNIKRAGEKNYKAEDTAWQLFAGWRVPVDDYSHLQVHTIAVFLDGEPSPEYVKRWHDFSDSDEEGHEVARKVMEGKVPYDDIPKLCHHVPLAQDEVCQVGQGVIPDRRKGVEFLGASDVAIVALRKLWVEELTALQEGRPLRNWQRPAGLLPKGGNEERKIE